MDRHVIEARFGRGGQLQRRDFLRTLGLGAAGVGLGFQDMLMAAAPQLKKEGKSVIVLWMAGGPSHMDTFDPKPNHENGKTCKSIKTAVSGIEISEHFPKLAQQMKHLTLIRSMNNKEGNHERATYQLHTGYQPSGTVKHPSFGSLVTSEIAPPDFDLPGFVSVNGPSMSQGFLPAQFMPFRVPNPAQMPTNSTATVPQQRYERRLGLLTELEQGYAKAGAKQTVEDHQILYSQASRLVLSPKLKAFDINQEDSKTIDRYGGANNVFGKGCLLARRLVETGVTFVEVTLGGWDMHDDINGRFTRTNGPQLDAGFSALVQDLADRRLLDNTLVLWMGEFGRTPKINPRAGRDHYPRAFSAVAAGMGFKGGKVVGSTNESGEDVKDRPVTINDLFTTVCEQLTINPRKENISPLGRPMKIVDGGETVKELLA